MSINISKLFLRLTSNAIRKYSAHFLNSPITNIQRRALCSDNSILISKPTNAEFDDEFDNNLLSDVDINAIVGDDPEKIEAMKRLLLEISLWRQQGDHLIPENITAKEWQQLLKNPDRKYRLGKLEYWYVQEKRKQHKKYNQDLLRERRLKEKAEKENNAGGKSIEYELAKNSLFFRIQNRYMNACYDYKLALAMMFGPHIVIDCSYEEYMRETELKGCALQIQYAWSVNRTSTKPFNIILCNVKEQSKVLEYMGVTFSNVKIPNTFITITNKHYTELFPREQLVYLTPHCNEELDKYDGNSVYIIGAYVDERVNRPISLANAKRENLRMAKFPIDRYLNWCQGSKLLPINQCVNIMNDLKDGACWQYAFKHIAPRKQTFHRFNNDIKPSRNKNIVRAYLRNQQEKTWLVNLQHQKRLEKAKSASEK